MSLCLLFYTTLLIYIYRFGKNNIIDLTDSSKGSQLHLSSNVKREAIAKKPFFMAIANYRSEDFTPLYYHLEVNTTITKNTPLHKIAHKTYLSFI